MVTKRKSRCLEVRKSPDLRDEMYTAKIRRKRFITRVAFMAFVLLSVYSLTTGSFDIEVKDIILALFKKGNKLHQTILIGSRLPRLAATILTGAILAVAGAVMQCVLNNPLASASTLGVSHGAAFGAALGIVVFGGGVVNSTSDTALEINNPYIVTLCAFVFGSATAVGILAVSQLKKGIDAAGLILAGVAISALFAGGSTLLQYFADETKLSAVVFWTFGNLGCADWQAVKILGTVFLAVLAYTSFNRWNYNAMCGGSETAKSLGVDVKNFMLFNMLIASLASSVAVSFVGIIGFIGLISPHITRLLTGNDYRYLIPVSAVMGALILIAADLFARMIIAPVILPIGAVTSFLGGPVFLFLLIKGGLHK